MAITPSELRRNVYRLLDQVLETGVPLEIERGGRRLRIVPSDPPSRFDRPGGNPEAIVGDPEDLVHLDWSGSWTPGV